MKIRAGVGQSAALFLALSLGACSSHSLSSNPPPPYSPPPAQPAPPPPAPPPTAYVAPPPAYVPPPPAPVEPAAPAGDFGSGSGASSANPAIAPGTVSSGALSPAASEILRLKDAGYSEDFLLNKVRRESQPYRLTVDDLIALRRAGLSETVIDAMLHAGGPSAPAAAADSVQPVSRHAEFDGMVRQQQGFLGIGGSKKKKIGKFVIDGDRVTWYQMIDQDDNFSLSERNVKEMWLNCAPRAGENLCLEICFKTYSGQEGCFRDAGWENGENRQVLAMYDYFQKAFPTTFFSKRERKTF